jgi:hypothetical protein
MAHGLPPDAILPPAGSHAPIAMMHLEALARTHRLGHYARGSVTSLSFRHGIDYSHDFSGAQALCSSRT